MTFENGLIVDEELNYSAVEVLLSKDLNHKDLIQSWRKRQPWSILLESRL